MYGFVYQLYNYVNILQIYRAYVCINAVQARDNCSGLQYLSGTPLVYALRVDMAALVKATRFSTQLINRKPGILYTAVRSHWNKDFKPGPVPQTEEERRAAAEKYNLHPDKYETYPDDGAGYGDYPKLPMISTESRDPFYPWDYPELLRNYNEPIHVYEEMINDTRYNVSYQHLLPLKEQFKILFIVLATFTGLFVFFEDKKEFPSILAKQMPNSGSSHYLFNDPPESSKPSHH